MPDAETIRLQALASYNILDTLPEEEYDSITQLAAQICQTPISLISLVDNHRQWFKSAHGLPIRQTPRQQALCTYAIQTPDEVMEIADTRVDARFSDNPLVVGDPHVIYYAGAPLVDADGQALGTLCVIDHKPRQLSAEQLRTLQTLGRQVVIQLQLHRSRAQLVQANEQMVLLNQELRERDRTEQRLQELLDQEKTLNERKNQFVAIVSHEFRTPLATIQSSVDLAKSYLNDSAPAAYGSVAKHLDIIQNQIRKFTDLLSDVLTLGQMEAGKLAFNPLPCDAEAFIRHLVDTVFTDQLDGRTVLISVKGVPRPVLLDEKLLNLILLNLLSNAFKYSDQNPVLELIFEPTEVVFAVIDTGMGIPADDLPHLFTSFFRAKNTRTIQGTGLGLYIARQFVDLLGGRIEVASQLGQGSVFRIVLPAHTDEANVSRCIADDPNC